MDEKIKKLPKITFNDFKKLIPMFLSDDLEIVTLGLELFQTYDYSELFFTVLWINFHFYPAFKLPNWSNIDKNSELDKLCKTHLTQAFKIKHNESYLRWLNVLQ